MVYLKQKTWACSEHWPVKRCRFPDKVYNKVMGTLRWYSCIALQFYGYFITMI